MAPTLVDGVQAIAALTGNAKHVLWSPEIGATCPGTPKTSRYRADCLVVSIDLLGRHVRGPSNHGARVSRTFFDFGRSTCQTKVYDDRFTLAVDHDTRRLQVATDGVVLMSATAKPLSRFSTQVIAACNAATSAVS